MNAEHADALEALLASVGWRVFYEHVMAEWSASACWRRAVKEIGFGASDIASGVEIMGKVSYTNEEVGKLMRWPADELARLRRAEQQPEASIGRRGTL